MKTKEFVFGSSHGVAVPELDATALTSGASVSDWLSKEIGACLSVKGLLPRVIAAGLIARFARVRLDRSSEATLIQSMLDADPPTRRARAWFANLSESVKRESVRAFVSDAYALAESLDSLQNSLVEKGTEKTRAFALGWCLQRDDLACAETVTQSSEITSALADLDARAADYGTMWSLLYPLPPCPRLEDAFTLEPDAWWPNLIE